jgi:hypothetical protein
MTLAKNMDAVAELIKVAEIVPRSYPYPVESINPPCAVVGYPDVYDYDLTARRGSDRMSLPVWLILGRVVERATRDAVSSLLAEGTVKAALDGDLDGTCQSCRVQGLTLETVSVAGLDYLALRLTLDITF